MILMQETRDGGLEVLKSPVNRNRSRRVSLQELRKAFRSVREEL